MTTFTPPTEAALIAVDREIDDVIRAHLTRRQPASVEAILAELMQRHPDVRGPDVPWYLAHLGEVVKSRIAVVIRTLKREHALPTTAEEWRTRGREAMEHADELERYRQLRAARKKKGGKS